MAKSFSVDIIGKAGAGKSALRAKMGVTDETPQAQLGSKYKATVREIGADVSEQQTDKPQAVIIAINPGMAKRTNNIKSQLVSQVARLTALYGEDIFQTLVIKVALTKSDNVSEANQASRLVAVTGEVLVVGTQHFSLQKEDVFFTSTQNLGLGVSSLLEATVKAVESKAYIKLEDAVESDEENTQKSVLQDPPADDDSSQPESSETEKLQSTNSTESGTNNPNDNELLPKVSLYKRFIGLSIAAVVVAVGVVMALGVLGAEPATVIAGLGLALTGALHLATETFRLFKPSTSVQQHAIIAGWFNKILSSMGQHLGSSAVAAGVMLLLASQVPFVPFTLSAALLPAIVLMGSGLLLGLITRAVEPVQLPDTGALMPKSNLKSGDSDTNQHTGPQFKMRASVLFGKQQTKIITESDDTSATKQNDDEKSPNDGSTQPPTQ